MPNVGPARGGTAIESQNSGESPGESPSAGPPGAEDTGRTGAQAGAPPAGTQPADRSGAAAIRSVLRIRPFRRLWIVLGAASFGDWLGLLATSVFAAAQVSGSTAQGAAFGTLIAIRLLPALILGPVAGVLADRFDRRWTMVICDVLRFLLFASIPLFALTGASGGLVVGWAAVATFLIETITLLWIPAKEAAVPNLIPRARLEAANQLTLITTYGLTPIAAALGLALLDRSVRAATGGEMPSWAEPAQLALWFNAFSRLATALVVAFGIKEISQAQASEAERTEQGVMRQFTEGWKYIGQTPLVRGLVLGIFGAFAGGGIVIGTAKFFAASLGAGDAAFYLLFGAMFIGLALGIGLGPMIVREMSRRRWFGMSIVLASASVVVLAFAVHLSMAMLGAILVGAGAGMAFLAGTTLLGGEVADEVRGRVFAVVQIGTRLVLILAIALSSLLVGVGGSRKLTIADLGISVSSTRLLLLAAGAAGIFAGISAFGQMDDKKGVPVLADLWGSIRGRPLMPAEHFVSSGLFVVFEGGEGAGKSTQLAALAERLRGQGREVVVTREPGATEVGARIRALLLDATAEGPSPRAEALLYAADRAHHVATVVRPALVRGAVVISDRYVDSSLAYQGAGRTLPVDEVSWLSSWATGGLKPDLVVLLDVDPHTGLSRVAARNEGADRLEAESVAFHERVRYAFLDLAANDPKRYLVLDASRPVEETAGLVARRVAEFLVDPAGIVHPRPAQGPDTSVQPELSDSELVTMEHRT
ncbi:MULTISPECIES: dTMP kinase [unclassified Micromonospora]|uniref:dTMP kinase n=1 Tax=Micromonospora TaxID=1873 RepID=UPI002417F355|nr:MULTISPECIES: dTMP kinase [unclassified Micromonospora]MDG4816723.1 dTMP kinase [Micromonospora sp. WMMD956]WFE59200.1 dTMP kinase [Micromonospora sp. WMMD712]